MFNLKAEKKKTAQVTSIEKYLRDNTLGPVADDGQPIEQKILPHRTGDIYTTTEDRMSKKHKFNEKDASDDAQVIEKILNEAKSAYATHRSDAAEISVPPINDIVERIRQERMSEFKTQKEPHWSQTYDEKKQFGSLPSWKKNAPQHDKTVLNNDPNRFKQKEPVPLVGNITTADVDKLAVKIKMGASADYDSAIAAILRVADDEERELNTVEQKAVSDLKIERTKALLSVS